MKPPDGRPSWFARCSFCLIRAVSVSALVLLILGSRFIPSDFSHKLHHQLTAAMARIQGTHEQKIMVNGKTRTYLIHHSAWMKQSGPAAPLILVFHGTGSDGYDMEIVTHLNHAVKGRKSIVVYPNGFRDAIHPSDWNGGDCCGEARDRNVDDIAFVRALIEKLKQEYPVDPRRIYVAGFSSGAIMAYRVACELSDQIAAFAPVAGALDFATCNPTQPVSAVVFHGTADDVVLYRGGVSPADLDKSHDQSVLDSTRFWASKNHCDMKPEKDARGNVIQERYRHCDRSTEVTVYTVVGGLHAWPGEGHGRKFRELTKAGEPFSATHEMIDFFLNHPKESDT